MWVAAAMAVMSIAANSKAKSNQAFRRRMAANANYEFEMSSLLATSQEVNVKAGEAMSERAREAMFKRGRLAVVGSESGLEGNTADRLARQTFFDEGFDTTRIDVDRQRAQDQITRERAAAKVRRDNPGGPEMPSGLANGLQIVGGIMNAWKPSPAAKTPTTPNSGMWFGNE
jgi:hypothetical protein